MAAKIKRKLRKQAQAKAKAPRRSAKSKAQRRAQKKKLEHKLERTLLARAIRRRLRRAARKARAKKAAAKAKRRALKRKLAKQTGMSRRAMRKLKRKAKVRALLAPRPPRVHSALACAAPARSCRLVEPQARSAQVPRGRGLLLEWRQAHAVPAQGRPLLRARWCVLPARPRVWPAAGRWLAAQVPQAAAEARRGRPRGHGQQQPRAEPPAPH